jgi:hypothetical protein
MDFLLVGIVCAAGLLIPVVLGFVDPDRRRRHRGR